MLKWEGELNEKWWSRGMPAPCTQEPSMDIQGMLRRCSSLCTVSSAQCNNTKMLSSIAHTEKGGRTMMDATVLR